MGNHKVADALLAVYHLANIDRLIAGQGIGGHAAGGLNNGLDIPFRFNADKQISRRVGVLFDRAQERPLDGFQRFEQRGQRIHHLRRRLGDFRQQQRFAPLQHRLGAERAALFPEQMADFPRGEFFTARQLRVEEQRFAESHRHQRAGRHHHESLFVFHRLLQGLQRSEERNDRRAVIFFPVLQIQRAIFNNLLAIGCAARYPDGGLKQRAEKCRTMSGLGSRFFQQGF